MLAVLRTYRLLSAAMAGVLLLGLGLPLVQELCAMPHAMPDHPAQGEAMAHAHDAMSHEEAAPMPAPRDQPQRTCCCGGPADAAPRPMPADCCFVDAAPAPVPPTLVVTAPALPTLATPVAAASLDPPVPDRLVPLPAAPVAPDPGVAPRLLFSVFLI